MSGARFNSLVFYIKTTKNLKEALFIAFFNSMIDLLGTLVIALGAGLGIWGVVNLVEGYGNDNPGANEQGR